MPQQLSRGMALSFMIFHGMYNMPISSLLLLLVLLAQVVYNQVQPLQINHWAIASQFRIFRICVF